jgi:non-homologous end joining protein Ku
VYKGAIAGEAKMVKRSKTALVGLRVRLREPLRKKLETAAKQRGVSLNAELVDRLEASFSAQAVEDKLAPQLTLVVKQTRENMHMLAELEEWLKTPEADRPELLKKRERDKKAEEEAKAYWAKRGFDEPPY